MERSSTEKAVKDVLLEASPLLAVVLIIAILAGLFLFGAFDAPAETIVTSATLTEAIQTAKLTTAKYIQHGIAKAHIEGKPEGYVLYYAVVKPNVDLSEITYEIDHKEKTVTVTLPEKFSFDVELLEDEQHKFYYHPEDQNHWTGKDVSYICKTDAKQKAEANTELIRKARKGLVSAIEILLKPMLNTSGYTLVFSMNDTPGGVGVG